MKRLHKIDAAQAAGRSYSTRKRSPRNWRQTIEPEFWPPKEGSGEEKQFTSGPNGTNETGNALPDPQSEALAHRAIAKHPSQAEEDVQAALFMLKELLNTPLYSKLELLEDTRDALVRGAILSPLPEGVKRVATINRRLKESLDAAKRDAKARSSGPTKPKRGRFRRTLCFDYKPRLNRRRGSESEDSREEAQPVEMNFLDEGDPLRLRTTIRKVLERTLDGCSQCCTIIPADKPRSTVLLVDQSNLQEIGAITRMAVHCEKCRDANIRGQIDVPTLEGESRLAGLTSEESEAFQLQQQELNQTEIGARMSPKRSQETVSRILKRVEDKRTTARLAKFCQTGGV